MFAHIPRHFLMICLLAALAPLVTGFGNVSSTTEAFPGWPSSFENRPLVALHGHARQSSA